MGLIKERLTERRKRQGLTQEGLSELVKISVPTIARMENGRSDPKTEELSRLAVALSTSVAYLIGETDFPERPDGLLGSLLGMNNPSPPSSTITMPAGPIRRVPEAIQREMQETRIDPSTIQVINEMVPVPVLDLRTCAGNGSSHLYEDIEVLYEVQLPSVWVGPISPYGDRKPFLTKIYGDSMSEAGLHDGALALVNPAVEAHSGDAALVCFGENRETALKWVYFLPGGAIELRSATPGFPIYNFTREQQASEDAPLVIIGKVMGEWGEPKRG